MESKKQRAKSIEKRLFTLNSNLKFRSLRMVERIEINLDGKSLIIETGKVAKQAHGAVTVRSGDTIILATVVEAKQVDEEQDFFPLLVDYREKAYAAGKIPGGFFKREGRPSEKETVSARLIDRALRPLFPEGYFNEIQIMVMVLSFDQENDPDVLGLVGASAALGISHVPFYEPVGAVRVGRINNQFVVNPRLPELEESQVNLVVAGTKDHINMAEGVCQETSEEDVLAALEFGHEKIKLLVKLQEEFRARCGKPKQKVETPSKNPELVEAVTNLALEKIREVNHTLDKTERQNKLEELLDSITLELLEKFPESENQIKAIFQELEKQDMRKMILTEGRRVDGREIHQIRPIFCEVGVLPRTHGSAIFTRGQTQCLAVTTLGTKMDEQIIDDLEGESTKSYMLHYNFPPFSVGEIKPIRGPGRREIGHGALAEKAIQPVIPKDETFPYTVRIVSDILESNGSSSMATVCGGTLSLMDAGVPIKAPVAGLALGLIKEEDKVAILSDILGVEDHLGDMDFKVTGTRKGVTAFQMDVKIAGVDLNLLNQALKRAKEGRLHILDIMDKTIAQPRPELSVYAPRIITFKVKPDKIGAIIGPGGKVIRAILEQTGAKIDIEDDGSVFIAAVDPKAGELAQELILKLIEEPEMGKEYIGKVKRITAFGAFVEILPGQDGLLHISELDTKRVERVEDILNVGDEVRVKIVGIDADGRIKLSRKACFAPKRK
jgi:polyribonucleotide nucleotidyltransferase